VLQSALIRAAGACSSMVSRDFLAETIDLTAQPAIDS
jgi:hypothetical protein